VRATFLLLLATLVGTDSTSAQTRISGPAPSLLFDTAHWQVSDSVKAQIKPTYWKEGMLIGGIAGAAGGGFLGYAFCQDSEDPDANCALSSVLGALGGALLLAIPGALIGGQFPKDSGP
jgi:hypothetical protein